MTHPRIILATAVALATASFSGGAMAASYGYGFDGDHDRLGWVIVSGGNTSMSDMKDLESMEDLKSEFGDEFLYLRLGEDRYVIRDRALMKRAQDALEPMQEAGREIGEIARAHAQRALAGSKDVREQARLARRIGKIARREARGESTEDLEREQEQLQQKLEDLTDADRAERGARREERWQEAREQEASERMRKLARRLNEEMRDILRDAKSRKLAEPVN